MVDMYLHQMNIEMSSGNPKEVFIKYLSRAEAGDNVSQYFIGQCYYNGWGVEESNKRAYDWFMKSALLNNKDGQYMVGKCYFCGFGVEHSYREAFRWYLKSAQQGNDNAQYSVGECYQYGMGVEADINQALIWYQRSAIQGNEEAKRKIYIFHSGCRNSVFDDMTLADIFGVDATNYDTVSIGKLLLSVRSINCLKGVDTVGELLRKTETNLLKIRNCGKKSVNEMKAALKDYFDSCSSDKNLCSEENNNSEGVRFSPKEDRPFRELLKIGHTESFAISIKELDIVTRGENCLKSRGCYTVEDLLSLSPLELISMKNMGKDTVENIYSQLFNFVQNLSKYDDISVVSKESVAEVIRDSQYGLSDKLVVPFLRVYEQHHKIEQESVLKKISDNARFRDLMEQELSDIELKEISIFVNWLNIDIASVARMNLLESIKETQRNVLVLRATNGKITLEDVAKVSEKPLSRERIRQLEDKAILMFIKKLISSEYDVVLFVRALYGGKDILSREDFTNIIGKVLTDCLFYVVTRSNRKYHESLSSLPYRHEWYSDVIFIRKSTEEESDDVVCPVEDDIACLEDRFVTVLSNYFPRGFNANKLFTSCLKFKECYEEIYNETLNLSNEDIRDCVRHFTINHDGIYYLPQQLLSEEDKISLKDYIDNYFQNGHKVLFYGILGREFGDKFIFNVKDDIKLLKKYVEFIFKGEYFFGKYYFSAGFHVVDVRQLVIDYVKEQNRIIGISEVREEFYYLLEHQINVALGDPHCIRNSKGQIFYVDYFAIDESGIARIAEIIDNNIRKYDLISGNKLYEEIKKEYPDILENNPEVTYLGLRQVLQYYLSDKFSFSGNYITFWGRKIYAKDIFSRYAKEHEKFTLRELEELGEEIDSQIVLSEVQNVAFRISKNEFAKTLPNDLDICAFDEELSKFVQGDYLPLGDVISFAGMPNVGLPWNSFLLQSCVHLLSDKYQLLPAKFSVSKPLGAIVRQGVRIDTEDDLLIRVLADSGMELERGAALDYLFNKGYLASRALNNIEIILLKAREMRNRA